MRRSIVTGFAAVAFLALAALPAFAQTSVISQKPIPLNTAGQSEMLIQSDAVTGGTLYTTIVKPSGNAQAPLAASTVFAPSSGTSTYLKAAPVTGFSLTMGNATKIMELNPSGTLAAGYVTFSPAPLDGAEQCVFSSKAITLFYPTANAGQSINNATTTIGAAARQCWLYSSSNTTWDRTQ